MFNLGEQNECIKQKLLLAKDEYIAVIRVVKVGSNLGVESVGQAEDWYNCP